MSYIPLGPRRATGTQGQLPPGVDTATAGATGGIYWTATFTHADMHISAAIRWYEVYRASVTGAANSTAQLFLQDYLFDQNAVAQSLSWDWTQPMHVNAGQDVKVYVWYPAAAAASPAPLVTIWLRYDPALMQSSVALSGIQ